MKNFEGFGLSPALNKSLAYMKYEAPTPIQIQAIPLALEGHDIMGSAQTGTGKTAAFAIPLIEKLLTNPHGSALVLTPTRELGKQIMDIMHQLLGPKSPIKTAFIIGGESMGKQLSQLRARPRLIVGTPGRINDHLERGNMMLHDTQFLVLDETDRMLDMGFTVQLERIFKYLPDKRQTLMFSATLPKNILRLSESYLNNPKRVSIGEVNVIAKNIKQEVIRIEQDKKYNELMSQLHDRNGSVIVFVKTKYNADRMAKNLRRDGFTSEALHGDLRQNKRDKVMQNFRNMNFRVLIATDIAARGLDVPHIEHVINYDLPQVAEDFIHRMGRTARAGAEGSAISFVSNQDGRKWHAIERLLNPQAKAEAGQRPKKKSESRSKHGSEKRPNDNVKPFAKKNKKNRKNKRECHSNRRKIAA
ncbi:MAG: DEAD/DEAH box helicase [Alphaproteobacteria bacterium]